MHEYRAHLQPSISIQLCLVLVTSIGQENRLVFSLLPPWAGAVSLKDASVVDLVLWTAIDTLALEKPIFTTAALFETILHAEIAFGDTWHEVVIVVRTAGRLGVDVEKCVIRENGACYFVDNAGFRTESSRTSEGTGSKEDAGRRRDHGFAEEHGAGAMWGCVSVVVAKGMVVSVWCVCFVSKGKPQRVEDWSGYNHKRLETQASVRCRTQDEEKIRRLRSSLEVK